MAVIFFIAPAAAQTTGVSGGCAYWIDSATGERARTVPIGVTGEELYRLQTDIDANRAHGASGRNYVRQPDGTWIDAATGKPARTVPIGVTGEELYRLQTDIDANQAHGASGRNYVLVPCPPPTQSSTAVPPPASAAPSIGMAPPPNAPVVWYYCDPAGAYYPSVQTCPTPWREVAAQPQSPPAAISPAIPIVPGIGFGFGFGGRHGDDRR